MRLSRVNSNDEKTFRPFINSSHELTTPSGNLNNSAVESDVGQTELSFDNKITHAGINT
jgi:hypothetical protein